MNITREYVDQLLSTPLCHVDERTWRAVAAFLRDEHDRVLAAAYDAAGGLPVTICHGFK